jgi:hypothetical protein
MIVLLLVLDAVIKFFKPKPVVDAFAHLGIPMLSTLRSELSYSCAPSSTPYRPLQSSALFFSRAISVAPSGATCAPAILCSAMSCFQPMGSFLWLGLYLRDLRLRVLIPLRTQQGSH